MNKKIVTPPTSKNVVKRRLKKHEAKLKSKRANKDFHTKEKEEPKSLTHTSSGQPKKKQRIVRAKVVAKVKLEKEKMLVKKKEEVLKWYAKFNCNLTRTSERVGLCKAAIRRMIEQDEEFNLAITEIEESLVDAIEEKTFRNARSNKNAVAERIFILKTRRRSKYGDKPEGEDGAKIVLNIDNMHMMRGGTNENSSKEGDRELHAPSSTIEVS